MMHVKTEEDSKTEYVELDQWNDQTGSWHTVECYARHESASLYITQNEGRFRIREVKEVVLISYVYPR